MLPPVVPAGWRIKAGFGPRLYISAENNYEVGSAIINKLLHLQLLVEHGTDRHGITAASADTCPIHSL